MNQLQPLPMQLSDPKLRGIAMRISNEMNLAMEKVISHHLYPTEFPMPENQETFEHVFLSRFKELKPETQKEAIKRVKSFMESSKQIRNKNYGDLTKVDLKSTKSISKQAKKIKLPKEFELPSNYLDNFITLNDLSNKNSKGPVPQNSHLYSKLHLNIKEIKCHDETGRWPEWGRDEIYLSGVDILSGSATRVIPPFYVGKFNTGDFVDYAPYSAGGHSLTSFDISGANFPAIFITSMVLCEKDMGGLAKYLTNLANVIKEVLTEYLGKLITGALQLGSIASFGVGFLVGFILDGAVRLLNRWWGDDIFPPKVLRIDVRSASEICNNHHYSESTTAYFEGFYGKYGVRFNWQLYDD